MIFESSFNTSTWEFFAHSIYLLQNARDHHFREPKDIRTLNSTIILNCAVTLEGALKTYLVAKLRDQNFFKSTERNRDRFTWSMVDRTLKEVQTASFEQLNKFAKECFSEDWSQFKGYTGICALFHFRNILAHGSIVEYRNVFEAKITEKSAVDDRKKIKEGWNKEPLMKFLFEQFESFKEYKNEPWHLMQRQLFTNEIANFYVVETRNFLRDVYSMDHTRKIEEAQHVVREIGTKSTPFVSLPNYSSLPKKKAKTGRG